MRRRLPRFRVRPASKATAPDRPPCAAALDNPNQVPKRAGVAVNQLADIPLVAVQGTAKGSRAKLHLPRFFNSPGKGHLGSQGLWCRIARLGRDRSGNVAVVVALLLPVLALTIGGAIDVVHAEAVRSDLSSVLDNATLAAAGDGDDRRAKVIIGSHLGARTDVTDYTAEFSFSNKQRSVVGQASATLDAHFLGIVGLPSLTVTAEAEAAMGDGARPCITLLDPTASQALLVNSGAKLIAPSCEIHVRSTASPAAIFNGGTRLDVARICVAGSRVTKNGGWTGNVETSCKASEDPFAGTLPTPPTSACTDLGGVREGRTARFQPGVYCGGINFNSSVDVDFAPGLYVIRGGNWMVNGGDWTGSGVTFYFEDSSRIHFNTGVKAKLSAPKDGLYRDILLFEKPGLGQSNFLFDDSRGSELDGLMYLPSRNMTYNSGSDARGDRLTMVFNTLILNDTDWKLEPADGQRGSGGPRLVR